nr:ribonuclease H-like domain-containing protein [Tanacetum cinerariifolium]
MSDHEEETINKENAHPKVVPQITTVTNISAKFPYLKKRDAKSMTTDKDGNLKIRPPVTAEEHQQVQREEKAMTILLSALLDEHMCDFYHIINARDIWNAIKARFGGNAESKKMQKSLLNQKFKEFKISEEEGLDKGYDKMQKILTQMNLLKIKPDPEDVNMKFLRGLPPSWSGIALILKTKGGLEYISFDDLYNKLKFLEIDTKGYSLSPFTLSHAAFVSTDGSSQGNLSYQELENGGYSGYTTTLSASPGSSSSKGSLESKCSVVDDVIYSFFTNHEIDQQLVYEDLDQMNKEEFKEYDLKHQMEMLSIKQMGHFSRECRAQGGQNSNNYQKYKSKEAGKDGSDSKAMVIVDGSIDWDKQTDEGNKEPRSLENYGMIAGIKIESDADSEGEVVSADNAIPAGVFIFAGNVAAVIVSPQFETEFALMGLSTEVSIPVTCPLTKRGLGLDKYIGEGELGIDDSQFSIFHTNSDELEGQPIYNRFASVDHMKAVPPPLTGNYMPLSNIPDIDESQMVYGKKTTDSSEIKTNDDSITHSNESILFDFSDRSSEPSTNDIKMYDLSVECSRPNHSDHDSTSSVSAPASESRDTIVIDCDKQEDFPSVCSIETDVKSSKPFYLHLIKYYDFHEQTFAKRNAEGKGILGKRPTGKPVNPNRPKPVFAGQQNSVSAGSPNLVFAGQQNTISAGQPNLVFADQPNPVSAGQPNTVSAGDGILGLRPLNIQPKSTYFHSFTHNNQQIIFPITHNSLYSLYLTGGLNGKTAVKPSTGNKDKLEDFEDFDGGEVTFGGSIGKISGKGTIKTKNLNFKNVLYVEELHHFNLISVSQICDQAHREIRSCQLQEYEQTGKGVSSTNLTASSQGATPSNAVVPIVDEATTQNDGTKSDLAQINADNLDELAKLQALQRQEQAGKEEADRLGLAFPSLNPILGVGTVTPLFVKKTLCHNLGVSSKHS